MSLLVEHAERARIVDIVAQNDAQRRTAANDVAINVPLYPSVMFRVLEVSEDDDNDGGRTSVRLGVWLCSSAPAAEMHELSVSRGSRGSERETCGAACVFDDWLRLELLSCGYPDMQFAVTVVGPVPPPSGARSERIELRHEYRAAAGAHDKEIAAFGVTCRVLSIVEELDDDGGCMVVEFGVFDMREGVACMQRLQVASCRSGEEQFSRFAQFRNLRFRYDGGWRSEASFCVTDISTSTP